MASISSTDSKPMPRLSLPEPIFSITPGTWAYDTMSRRIDAEILQRTWDDNREIWSQPAFIDVKKRFEALRLELQTAADTKLTYLDPLSEDASEERKQEWNEWMNIVSPFVEKDDTWLSAPWMVTEFYVYRKLMQCLDYWNPESPGYMYDPFSSQKDAGLSSSVTSAEAMLAKIPDLPKNAAGIEIAVSIALWGNKMDLSLWPADASTADQDVFSEILDAATENLLHDDTEVLAAHCDKLRSKGGGMVDIIVDNAGFELVTDLALAQHLVESGIAKTVTFQLKSHPTFVSDALEKDLLQTVEHYVNIDMDKFPNAHKAGLVWHKFLSTGQWKCSENSFWVQGAAMWEISAHLRADMSSRCELAFVKGDANYRRLLGDRRWHYTAPFEEVVGAYFPCPVCALRTLKAELGCGMDANQVERASKMDENWMVNGRFGVVQFGYGFDEPTD
ncbi:predicted protein [Phaeodactylum tricornutum CCAP 1055/1]|jgi:hypothetical protein|uniref:Sugar phosphate phosphatase n=1 Tax=Phaeodactylum tricornutum (strain CCAP 1055/1) TaxID=556484 RepID=B7FUH4_PHATC|nr:predicted protein [Phaeodactylum tricornutum CCAP 1055/1]EEC50261.1 predicted protein [Phaeodactylum tricornutum CCAP 1055/1]|eukprot:XP_002178596.1 predicted protein [Phaeodactylum tricornutum CCAP 1055/1]